LEAEHECFHLFDKAVSRLPTGDCITGTRVDTN
jgi:hypothetical protein